MIEHCEMDSKARSIIDAVFASTERAGSWFRISLPRRNAESAGALDLNEIVRNVMAPKSE
jgi:hypothetical protein